MASSSVSRSDLEAGYFPSFSQRERAQARAVWMQAKAAVEKGDKKGETDFKRFKQPREIARETLELAKLIDPPNTGKKPTAEQANVLTRFENAVNDKVHQWEADNKKDAPEAQIREIAAQELSRSVFIDREPWFWFNSVEKKRVVELTEDDRGRARIPWDSIDDVKRQKLIKLFGPANKTPTIDKMERMMVALDLDDDALLKKIINE